MYREEPLDKKLDRLQSEAEILRHNVKLSLEELEQLLVRQQEVLSETAAATATLAAVRASNSGRIAERVRTLRARLQFLR